MGSESIAHEAEGRSYDFFLYRDKIPFKIKSRLS